MNIFDFRHRLIDDYAAYTRSFIQILDPHVRQYVNGRLEAGVLWPDPLILTTGTGSGKSMAYIVPAVDFVLRRGSRRGIQAIVVYPMNALANSQRGELRKFLCHGYPDGHGPVTFERYTGQESAEERERILAQPPDILLTDYVMLELILTRPQERPLIAAAQGLQFLVLDELHT